MGRCFLFAAAEMYGVYEKPRPGDLVIAADAGYLRCTETGITPDWIIGDFDSMPEPVFDTPPDIAFNTPPDTWSPVPDTSVNPSTTSAVPSVTLPDMSAAIPPPKIRRAPVEKDDTDAMLAVKMGLSNGCEEFYLYGCAGGNRPDHTIANLQTLLYLRRHNAHGVLYDKCFAWTVIENETFELRRWVENGVVSIFSLTNTAQGVSLDGLYYPLDNAVLTAAFPLGVGNHFTHSRAHITVRDGALLVGWELPPAENPLTPSQTSANIIGR